MNKGTRIRTALGILTTINTVLAVTDVTQFGNEKLTLAYKIISVLVNAIVVAINTYYNNDYTEEACIGTGIARQMKAEKKEGYIGDSFYKDYDQEYVEDSEEDRGADPDDYVNEEEGEEDE